MGEKVRAKGPEDLTMITELNKLDFHKIRQLTDQCKNIEVRAIINGMNPGRVFADHPSEPTAAIIWIQGQRGFQIIGDARSGVFADYSGISSFEGNNEN